jgi:hypothetical protein
MRRSLSARQRMPGPSSRVTARAAVLATRTRSSSCAPVEPWLPAFGGSIVPSRQDSAASAQTASIAARSRLTGNYSSSAIRGASRLKIQTPKTQTTT